MRRHELRTARGYLEALIQVNQDCRWYIEGIVAPDISEDGQTATYTEEKDKLINGEFVKETTRSRTFTSSDGFRWDSANFPHCFGWQECCHEDYYHGQMLFPLDGKEYLLISFEC